MLNLIKPKDQILCSVHGNSSWWFKSEKQHRRRFVLKFFFIIWIVFTVCTIILGKKSVAIKITFHNLYDQNKLNTKENCLPAHMDPGRYVSSLIWHRVNKRCESGPALSDHRLVQNSDLTWLCLLGFNNTRLHWTRLKTLNLQTSVRNAPERGPYTAAASL